MIGDDSEVGLQDLRDLKVKDMILDSKPRKEKIKSVFANERVLAESSDETRELYNQSRYGTFLDTGKLQLSLLEGLYLLEKNKIEIYDSRNKLIGFDSF